MTAAWEEDAVRDGLWWLMTRDGSNYSHWCACIRISADGTVRGFLLGDAAHDEDDMNACAVFGSLEEARKVLAVQARLGGLY
jgi:hypothetical protein